MREREGGGPSLSARAWAAPLFVFFQHPIRAILHRCELIISASFAACAAQAGQAARLFLRRFVVLRLGVRVHGESLQWLKMSNEWTCRLYSRVVCWNGARRQRKSRNKIGKERTHANGKRVTTKSCPS
jgi:hypothetical protein